MIVVTLILCLETYAQDKVPSKPNAVIRDRPVLELLNLIANRQILENELKDGDYPKSDWEVVKKAVLPKTMYWSYPTGVTLLAMQRVYAITHDGRIMKFVNDNNRISADWYAYLRWQKMKFGTFYKHANFEKLWRLDMLDDCGAMGAAILESKLRHGVALTENLDQLVEIIGNYITKVQFRLPDGTFWRPNSPDGLTIWADDLYMSLPCLIRWAEYKHEPSCLDDAAQQIINYASYLQDKDGVWFHGYFVDKKSPTCCKWGRANGWVAVAIAEVLSVLPKEHPKYKQVLEICKKHIDGLRRYQSASGLWHQVLDHPELTWGTETSCSAQFAYAIARGINRGWFDTSYVKVVQTALKGLKPRINDVGGIDKVSRSTSIGLDLDYYNNRPTQDDDHHGNGLMLLALTEIHAMQQRGMGIE
jgi:unsaturated rhamnogalacturonyl hydrolase